MVVPTPADDVVLVVVDLFFLLLVVAADAVQVLLGGGDVRMRQLPVAPEALGVDEPGGAVRAQRTRIRTLARVPQTVPLKARRVLVGLAAVRAVIGPRRGEEWT